MLIETAALATLVISLLIGIVHFYDRFSVKGMYQRGFGAGQKAQTAIQALEPHLAMINESIAELKVALTPSPEAERQAAETFSKLSAAVQEGVQAPIEAAFAKFEASFQTFGDQVAQGLSAGLSSLGGKEAGVASGDAKRARGVEAVGAKKLLSLVAGRVHPLGGMAIAAGEALGVLDDETAIKWAQYLIDNPEAHAKLTQKAQQLIGQRDSSGGSAQESQGGGTPSYMRA